MTIANSSSITITTGSSYTLAPLLGVWNGNMEHLVVQLGNHTKATWCILRRMQPSHWDTAREYIWGWVGGHDGPKPLGKFGQIAVA